MHQFTSKNQKTGKLGEDIAAEFLRKRGFLILERNYTKVMGELDIIAQKNGITHFIEVKTVVKHGKSYHPFENITPYKLKKLSRVIQYYLKERHVSHETPWTVDAVSVIINREEGSAKVEVLWKIT